MAETTPPKKIALLGYGRENKSLLRFLRRDKKFRQAEFWVLDENPSVTVPKGVRTQTGKIYLSGLTQFDIIFRTPGIPYNLPALRRAREAGVEISSATAIFFERCRAKILGVTGTKGKGTTSTLIHKMLRAGGKRAILAGNIGTPMIDLLPKLDRRAWAVLELSSFQLQDLTRSPHVALVLDIFPDHQDSHADLKEYYAAKANITRHQTRQDLLFYAQTSPVTRRIAARSRARKVAIAPKKFTLFRPEDLAIRGEHNFRNAVAAATVALHLGVPTRIVREVATRFRGLPHRLEFVRRIDGVSFWNDSASTNPHTSSAAILAFPGAVNVLIAGGQDKNLDYAPLKKTLTSKGCRAGSMLVVLIGENRQKIRKALASACAITQMANDLKSAVDYAYHAARMTRNRANVVFSPGAASFDMFLNYADRGEQFRKIVHRLT